MRKLLTNGTPSEECIHTCIVSYAKKYKQISPYVLHMPNEGKRSNQFGKKLKSMGMRKGASDLFIAMTSRNYSGAWIEIKSKNGSLSEEQLIFLEDMEKQNYFTAVCWSLDEGIALINWYCLNKGWVAISGLPFPSKFRTFHQLEWDGFIL